MIPQIIIATWLAATFVVTAAAALQRRRVVLRERELGVLMTGVVIEFAVLAAGGFFG